MVLYTRSLLQRLKKVVTMALPQFALPRSASVNLLTVSENATFQVLSGSRRFIVRVYRPAYHSNEEIASELLWMRALSTRRTIDLPRIYANSEDQDILEIDGWRLACFEFLTGEEPRLNYNIVETFVKIGQIAAKLHDQSRNWVRPANFTRKTWVYETMIGSNAYWGDWRKITSLDAKDHQVLTTCDQLLQSRTEQYVWQSSEFGLIHGDLRAANLLHFNGQIAVIDFDDCGFSWFALDLANSLSFIEHEPVVPELIAAWFSGYSRVNQPTDFMRQILPDLIMMRRLQLTAWLVSHSETPTAHELGDSFHKTTAVLARDWLEGKMTGRWD